MKLPFTFRPARFLIVAIISSAILFLVLRRNHIREQPGRNEVAIHAIHNNGSSVHQRNTGLQEKHPIGDDTRNPEPDTIGDSTEIESAKDLLYRFYSENPDIEKRSRFCSDLIAKLCRSGRSEEAWSLIDPNFGNIRRSGIVGYFASSEDTAADLVAKLRELDPKSDFQAAYTGLSFRFPVQDLARFLTSVDFKNFSDEVKDYDMKKGISNALSGSLQLALIRAEDQNQIIATFEAARSLHDSDFLNREMFMNLLVKDKTGDAFSKWSYVEGLDENSEWGEGALKARREVILKMISQDSNRAIEMLLQDDGVWSESDIHSAISLWSSMDSGSAAAWFAAHRGALDTSQLDLVASGFSNAAMESGEFESARLWAQQVNSSETKGKLLGRISHLADSQ